MKTVRRMLAGLVSLFAVLAHAAPQDGWWWNAGEGGRGFFLEVQGAGIFMAGYFYDPSGRATWLVSNGPMLNADAYDGRLLSYGNGQTLVGNYHAPNAGVDAGAISLRFSDATHGTLTWPGGAVSIARYDYHNAATPSLKPRTGWWWSPDESGRGYSIEMQGDRVFIGAFMYDTSGNPVWYAADAVMQSPTVFGGELQQYAGGQTLTGSYRPPSGASAIGRMTLEFTTAESATLTLSDVKSGKAFKVVNVKPLYDRALPAKSATLWSGYYEYTRVATIGPIVNEYDIDIPLVTWTQPVDLDTGSYPAFYKILSGFANLKVNQVSPFCVIEGKLIVKLGGDDGDLTVNHDASYNGRIVRNGTMPVTETCTFPTSTVIVPQILPYSIDLRFTGSAASGHMEGKVPSAGVAGVVETGDWIFLPAY